MIASLGKYPWADMQRLKKPRDHLGERKNCPSVKSNAFQLIGLRRVDVGGQAFKPTDGRRRSVYEPPRYCRYRTRRSR